MSRVTPSFVAAAAVTLTAVTSAQAGCCGGCCNTGYAVGYALVQPAPVVVQTVQPVVQQYVVQQGPVYAGPMLTDYNPAVYYAPRATASYPYVAGHPYAGNWRWSGYRHADYAPRPYWRRPHYHHQHHGYPPVRRYY